MSRSKPRASGPKAAFAKMVARGSEPAVMDQGDPVSRTEWYWLGAALLVGAILRLSYLDRLAVEHFDEGVYASNIVFGAEDNYEYPARHLYAPPLLPMAIEWTIILSSLVGLKPTGFVPMIPCLIAGLATIPSLWWIGRRWSGPSAGVLAAWMCALSDFHSSYSRTALTDVPLVLFLLWAVYFMGLALTDGLPRDVVLAGLMTALAWWTKYNGWLPLAIGLSGGTAWQLWLPASERQLRRMLVRWGQVAAIAFVLWTPVLWGLQKHGGYAAVAANHKGYLVGFSGWCASALRQLTHVAIYDNWIGCAIDVAKVATVPGLLNLAGFVLVLMTPLGLLAASLIGFGTKLLPRRAPADESRTSPPAVYWLHLVWLVGLTLTTPLYRPYPRLVLPWLAACWLGTAVALNLLCRRESLFGMRLRPTGNDNTTSHWWPSRLEKILIASLTSITLARLVMGSMAVWESRTTAHEIATTIKESIHRNCQAERRSSHEALIYVYGQPAMVFHLASNRDFVVRPVQDANVTAGPIPTYFALYERTESAAPVTARLPFADPSLAPSLVWLRHPATHQWSYLVSLDQANGIELTSAPVPQNYDGKLLQLLRLSE